MSRHWRTQRTVIENHDRAPLKPRGAGALLVLGMIFAAIIGWMMWRAWPAQQVESGLSSQIEWNAVQAVPTRTPDPEDIEWQKRAAQPFVIANPAEQQGEAIQAGLPRTSSARDDDSSITTGKLYVIDGDTFSIGNERIRIAGMDAPETHPPRCMREAELGLAATTKLKELLSSGIVAMGPATRDKYGRELRHVFINNVDVAQTMIAAGLASSYSGGRRQSWC